MQDLPTLRKPQAKEPADITRFVKLVQQGIDAWTEAGKHLVVMIEQDKDFLMTMRKAHPEISMDMLTVFERIGRKQIYAPLLANSSQGARALLELPYDVQQKYCTGLVPVVVKRSGNYVTERKRLDELNRSEVKQVFDFDCVVTAERQEKRLREMTTTKTPVAYSAPASFVKREEIGCFRLHFEQGLLTWTPAKKNGREYSIRMVDGKDGPEAFVALYK